MPINRRGLGVFALACTLAWIGAARVEDEPMPATGEDRALVRLLSTRIRIRATGDAPAGRCLDLGARDLEVRLRGRALDDASSIELERDRPPTVHALLIDTSRSMIGSLEAVRAAATRYVERLDPGRDSGLVTTFDDEVVLEQAVAADRERLVSAIQAVEMGTSTALLDALTYVLRELGTRRERRVVLLLTDGVDTASLNERHDVAALAARIDARVFTIGFQLPPIDARATGVTVTRSFLQRLAESTHGEFFDTPRPEQLDRVYQRVRELVDGEATLNLVDPAPHEASTRLDVRSKLAGCRIEMLGSAAVSPSSTEAVEPPWTELPRRLPLVFGEAWREHLNRAHHDVAPECGGADAGLRADPELLAARAWFVTGGEGALRGCTLDVRRDRGRLYDPVYQTWTSYNSWLELETRPFAIHLPPFAALPAEPGSALDALSDEAWRAGLAEDAERTKPRPEEHSRPHGAYPMLVNGRTFLEMRRELARATFLEPDYREWVLSRLEDETGREIERLRERYRRRLPHISNEIIDSAIFASEEGRAILREASRPSVESLERHLAAWLGDLSAHELFTAWEARHVERLVSRSGEPSLAEKWSALRSVFRTPSYVRVLTLLAPVHDRDRDAVGYWRIVLPRVSWFQPRMPGFQRHPEWSSLPLDLVPDLPFAYLALERALQQDTELSARLGVGSWSAERPQYELMGRLRFHTPVRAYQSARVKLVLWRRDRTDEGLEVTADVGLDENGAAIEPALSWRSLGPQFDQGVPD